MSSKNKPKSLIMEAVHETASDIHHLGFIDKRKMREFDSLCLAPIQGYTGEKIQAIRKRYKLSQAVLASLLNTSLSTVRQWEIGKKHPSGPSLKLLDLLERKGLDVLI
ncbi:MAG: transcriptional regulator [Desulfobacterales bacterium CG2_30_60_27]|nr:MAG: transcriptional regulator [Desulfobacterales bacterium CG2_30_60_27]